MFQNLIQQRVDGLAQTLQRSVAIDDVNINLVAVSKHFNDADEARVRAILARTLEEASCRYLLSFDIAMTEEKIVRIPSRPELGFKERSCYPIRWDGNTLGYLWLVGSVSPAEDKAAAACAAELAVPMFSMHLEDEYQFSKHELIVRDLLSMDVRKTSRAMSILAHEGYVHSTCAYRVLCAAAGNEERRHEELMFLRRQLREFAAVHAAKGKPAQPLFTESQPDLLIVIPADSQLADPTRLTEIACSGAQSSLKIGIGPEADVLHLYDSYMQASSVLQVLLAIPNMAPCATWSGLGVYGNLALLTRNHENASFPLTPNIEALQAEDAGLLETLERFLDNAGNIAKTSTELCIHRSTLYYRLKRIEDITQMDLDSGLDRFTLHLELKFSHLTHALVSEQGS